MDIRYPEVFTLLNGDLEPRCQEIEVASSFQIPHFQIIGLPGPEVSEAKDRVRSAIESSGFEFPRRKIVMNLSPASVRKKGTGLDFAMAVALLIESWRIEKKTGPFPAERIFAWGELGLDGRLKSVRSPARAIQAARLGKADLILIAKSDEDRFREVARDLFSDGQTPAILALAHLADAPRALFGECPANPSPSLSPTVPRKATSPLLPISESMATLLQIAAAGAHHFLLLGPKGAGKSVALEWFLALQPELDNETQRTRQFISEISGREIEAPYRRVSTQAKPAALLGSFSGGCLRPGEFSLAHGGVLLADEFPEWSRDSREALREPLERRRVTLTRVDGSLELPADFTFAGNGNLCPCGGIPDSPSDSAFSPCRCLPAERGKYFAKLSGPILDRLDLVAIVLNPPRCTPAIRDEAALVRETIEARKRLVTRYGLPPGKLPPEALEELLGKHPFLRESLDTIRYPSFRDRHKTLRIALTLAALEGREFPSIETLRRARAYRLESSKLGRFPGGA